MSLVVRKENAPQTLRVVHDPLPSPALNFSLIRNLFSWDERLSLLYYPVLAWNECVTFSGLILSFHKDPDLAKIIARLNKLALRTLPDEDKQARLLQDARKILEPQITYQVDIQNQLASNRAREEKSRTLSRLKKQAFAVYFNQGGRETRQKIDEALLQAEQNNTTENLTTLQHYWKANGANEWGAEWHETLEKEIYLVLNQALEKGSSRAATIRETLFRHRSGRSTKLVLEVAIQEAAEQWAAAPQNKSRYCGDPNKLNYILLKGNLWKIPLMRSCQKEILQSLIAKTSNAIKTLARQREKEIQDEIAQLSEALSSPACCVDREAVKARLGYPASESMIESRLKANQEERAYCLNALERAQIYTPEKCLEWARMQLNNDPQEIERVLNEETPYDRNVIEVLRLTGIIEDADLHTQEMSLDLKRLPDPVAYFVEQFKKRDEAALALFSQVTEVTDSLPDPIPAVAISH